MEYQVITTAWNVLYEGTDLNEAERVMEDEGGFQMLARTDASSPFLAVDDTE